MAVATLILVLQGNAVMTHCHRRRDDPVWFRGHRDARIGWGWILYEIGVNNPDYPDGSRIK